MALGRKGEAEQAKATSDALTAHLEDLYAFAQVLTLDADRAADLVEATCRRFYVLGPEARPAAPDRAWLYQFMLRLRDEQRGAAAAAVGDDWEDTPPGGVYRRRVAERYVERALPAALAALPEQQRLLLLLGEAKGLSGSELGAVVGLSAAQAQARLAQARTRLTHALRTGADAQERFLLDTSLPADWLPAALAQTLQAEFAPMPPTLRATAEAIAGEARAAPVPASPKARLPSWQRAVQVAALFVIGGLLIGALVYFVSSWLQQEPEADLIVLSAEQAQAVTPTFRTSSAEQVERFIRDRLGWRLTVPDIEAAVLQGMGIREIAPGVEVPVLLYDDGSSGLPVVLYVYSYALLDQYGDRIELAQDVLDQIQDDLHFDLFALENEQVLVWRHRDDIYVAVTRGDAESLRDRISFPS